MLREAFHALRRMNLALPEHGVQEAVAQAMTVPRTVVIAVDREGTSVYVVPGLAHKDSRELLHDALLALDETPSESRMDN